MIRLVTPDFFEMTSSYIEANNQNNSELSEFIKIEILEQARIESYSNLKLKLKGLNQNWKCLKWRLPQWETTSKY